jgi:hypothetical protein
VVVVAEVVDGYAVERWWLTNETKRRKKTKQNAVSQVVIMVRCN